MAITRTDYPITQQGGTVEFDGTSIWTARQGTTSSAQGDTIFLTQLDPTTGTELNSFQSVGAGNAITPGDMVFFGGNIWFIEDDQFLDTIDPATGAMLNQFVIGTSPSPNGVTGRAIATDGTNLFVQFMYIDAGFNFTSSMIAVDPAGPSIIWQTDFSVSSDGFDAIVQDGRVWAVTRFGATLYGMDLASGAVLSTVPIPGTQLGQIAAGPGPTTITLLDFLGNLYQVDTGTLAVSGPFPIPAARFPYNLVIDPSNNIWVEDQDFGTNQFFFDVFNPASNPVATLGTDFSDTGTGMAYESVSGRIWASTYDPASNPQMTALGLGGGNPGRFMGTHVGFMQAGQFGGGTK